MQDVLIWQIICNSSNKNKAVARIPVPALIVLKFAVLVVFKILQIKLVQWSLIKIIFPQDGSPTLTSIYMRLVAFLKSFFEAQ